MDKYILYRLTNAFNSKTYIGITKFNNPNHRWINGHGYRKTSLISQAIVKYGWSNFNKEILHSELSKETACQLEITYIKKYKELGMSYNIGEGGEGSDSMSEETKEKLRQYKGEKASFYGRKHSPESIKKISESLTGRTRLDSTKKKISEKALLNKGKRIITVSEKLRRATSERFSIPVLQYALSGEFIKEYSSITQAQLELNIKSNHIGCCCMGRRKSCSGYLWKYKNTSI